MRRAGNRRKVVARPGGAGVSTELNILTGPGSGIAARAASFTLRHRVFRMIWSVTWTVLAAWTPAPLVAWRRLVLGAFGANIHPTARVYGSARIWYPPNLTMAAGAVLGPRSNCYSVARITLGDGAIVSQGAHLCTGTHDIDDPGFQLIAAPIVIGRNAWVAAEAFVGPGITIGEGAVLGARGVAFSDLVPWGVYAGNPARLLRTRQRPPHQG